MGSEAWLFCAFMAVVAFVLNVSIGAGNYISTSIIPVKAESLQRTVNQARSQGADLELAAITTEIVKFNQELDTLKEFWYPQFWMWIDDDILSVERVK